MPWVRNPDAGGVKINDAVQYRTKKRILTHAEQFFRDKYNRLEIRFRGQFCYVDAIIEPTVPQDWPPPDWRESREAYIARLRNTPTHLFRLRYFGDENGWAFAFYAYSSEGYELSVLPTGDFFGTPEEAFDAAAACYLTSVLDERKVTAFANAATVPMNRLSTASTERLRLPSKSTFPYQAPGARTVPRKKLEAEPAPEAEQPKATKAQAIRDALAADPKGMPKDIAEKLSAEGWNVRAQEVSQAKFLLKAKTKKGGRKAVTKPADAAPAAAVPADLVSVAALQKAKKLIQELGGVAEAKQALAALSQLLD